MASASIGAVAAEQARERDDELREGLVVGERIAVRVVAARAVAAPVHRAVVRHAAQALRRHRALQRMEDGSPAAEVERVRVVHARVVGIAEVPGQAVEVAEDVAARARRLAVAGRRARVVEERPARDDARRARGRAAATCATSRRVATSITETPLSKRVST